MEKNKLLEIAYSRCQNNIANFQDIEYIEDYKDVVYMLLKKAMKSNFLLYGIDKERFNRINAFCEMVICFEKLPNVVKECFKLIKGDYKYLMITKNINYFFEKEYNDEISLVYIDDIKDDIKRSLYDNNLTEKELILLIQIASNRENVLDANLEELFKSLIR